TIIGPDRKFLKTNRVFQDMLGYTEDELQAVDFTSVTHPDYAESGQRIFEQLRLGTLTHHRREKRYIRKDGSLTWADMAASAVRDSNGKLQYCIAVVADIAERKRAEEELKQTLENLQRVMNGITNAMGVIVEARDPYTAGHQRRVTQLAYALAQEIGLPPKQLEAIQVAGILHDIGKICVPAEILSKPGKISEPEFALIKNHPQMGYDILKGIEFPGPVAQAVKQHHERLDGSGYPDGLRGEEIILEARILGVSDVVEAMSSHRPYRPALGVANALEEISQKRAILYDPGVVDACLRLFMDKGFQFN
ncbi:MAG: PAS domain S-box protein, partial [Chloroflexi bacterium]|nr:PAS domain S-box protein [Chloroflexota bacterium]